MADSFTPEQLENFNKFFELIAAVNQELDPLAKGEKEQAIAAEKAAKELKRLSDTLKDQLGVSVKSFGSALVSPKEGLGKFGSAVDGATSAVGNFAAAFGPVGKVIGFFLKALGTISASALELNDNLMKSYNTLSEMGSVTEGGLAGLKSQLDKLGLTAAEAEKFEKALKPVTKEMTIFGGSVTAGRNKLVGVLEGMIGPTNEYERSLNRIGITTQDMREGVAEYLAQQARMGLTQGRSVESLQQASQKYLTTMKELQELTGQSRDSLEKEKQAQLSDARFNLYLRGLDEKERENLSNYMIAYKDQFGKDAAAGLQDLLVNQGRITTDQAAASFQAAQRAREYALEAMQGGTNTFGNSIKKTALDIDKNIKRFHSTLMTAENSLASMGLNNEVINGTITAQNKDFKLYGNTIRNVRDTTKKADEQLEKNIRNEQLLRANRLLADELLYEVSRGLVQVFGLLSMVSFKLGKTMAKVVDKFSSLFPGADSNLSRFFRESSDVDEEIKEIQNENKLAKDKLAEKEKQLAATQNEANSKDELDQARKRLVDIQAELKTARETRDRDKIRKLEDSLAREKKNIDNLEIIHLQTNNTKEKRASSLKAEVEKLKKEVDDRQKVILEKQKEREKLKKQETQFVNPDLPATAIPKDQIPGQEDPAGKKSKAGSNRIGSNTRYDVDATGKKVSETELASRKAAAAELPQAGAGREAEILNKLNFDGKRAERTGGGGATPQLLGIAERIKNLFGEGTIFTALNDKMHKREHPNSIHTIGKALDFKLPDHLAPKNIEEARLIKEKLKALGANKVLDEYFEDVNDYTKGKHFHVEVAKFGGLFRGPEQGYPVMLHGKESAWPEDKLKGLLNDVKKASIDQYKEDLMSDMGLRPGSSTAPTMQQDNTQMVDAFTVFNRKLDDLVSLMSRSTNIQDELLTYTRA